MVIDSFIVQTRLPILVDIVTLLKCRCLCDVVKIFVLVKLIKVHFVWLMYFLLHCRFYHSGE